MYVLAFDTSTIWGSVALLHNRELIGECNIQVSKTHSSTLMPMIDFVLQSSGLSINEIDLLVVSLGPGSFTGLRIGVTTGKALAFATGKPIVGVSSLHALALEAKNTASPKETIIPILDARRQEVYWTKYRKTGAHLVEMMEPKAEPLEIVAEALDQLDHCLICGDGAGKFAKQIGELVPGKASFSSSYNALPRAYYNGLIGHVQFTEKGADDTHTLGPIYIRLPDVRSPQKQVFRPGT